MFGCRRYFDKISSLQSSCDVKALDNATCCDKVQCGETVQCMQVSCHGDAHMLQLLLEPFQRGLIVVLQESWSFQRTAVNVRHDKLALLWCWQQWSSEHSYTWRSDSGQSYSTDVCQRSRQWQTAGNFYLKHDYRYTCHNTITLVCSGGHKVSPGRLVPNGSIQSSKQGLSSCK